ncbi:MAG: Asp-tRNA(Asn)/Glu-tRNA(Gln) amidotransferase subunit GatA [Oscillospiraceae bacterium]|nr:Asp-tRNA(Asn)/Glu-tRNA(Gln) amidotransferase subunit GatA [Oscillospiraceae bacterium]
MSLYKKSASELSQMLRSRQCSSVEICSSIIERINITEEKLGAYITVCNDIMEQAAAADRKISAGGNIHALTGIPIGIKDNISTKGIKTTCASKMLENYTPPYDAYVIKKIKKAGMIITGKLNMDEFAIGSSTENSYYKKTCNPHNGMYVPGGSSGGCAAAVMSGEAVMTIGSDTGGSVRQPSAFCGAVGLKPTYGSVSRNGLIAFASSLDQIGPLCRNVKDTSMLYSLICGHDYSDATSSKRDYADFSENLCTDVRNICIGIPEEYFGDEADDCVKEGVMTAVKLLESKGASLKRISLKNTKYAVNAYYIISSAEASSNLARYDGVRYGYRAEHFDGLTDMYVKSRSQGFGSEVKRRIMLGTFVLSAGYYDEYYKKANNTRRLIKQEFNEAFKECDVIITPTYPGTAFRLNERKDNFLKLYADDMYTVPASLAGIPAISIPCGYSADGLPIGMQIMGRPFSEQKLLDIAYAFETISGGINYMSDKFMSGGGHNAGI